MKGTTGRRLLQLAIAWSEIFGKRNPVAQAEFTFHCESGTKELVTELASYGGTHLTLAAVWYLLVCHVDLGGPEPRLNRI